MSDLSEDSEKIRQVLTQAEALSASYRASARIQGMRLMACCMKLAACVMRWKPSGIHSHGALRPLCALSAI
nr:hypothetical protein [Acetobacter persici]